MAKQHSEANESEVLNASTPPPDQRVSMSMAELVALIAQMNSEAEARSAKTIEALTAALIDSKKPYVDPKTAENDEKFRAATRMQEERKRAAVKSSQSTCEHKAGSLGDISDPGQRTSIVWHKTDIREQVGICTICQKQFREGDPDYAFWRSKKSFNKMSASGQDRYIPDPRAALLAAR